MKIITNADDLGADAATSEAIFALMREGLVTSSTILAGGLGVADACRRSADFKQCSFGIHLNLTEFRPLTEVRGLGQLVGADGNFNASVRHLRQLGALRPAIYAEFCAQVARVQSLGVRISHLDSHHHIHTVPALLPVIKAVQKRFGLRKVRISRNLYTPAGRPSRVLQFKKVVFNAVLRHWFPSVTTDVFTDLESFAAASPVFLDRVRSIEIMLHPGGIGDPAETIALRQLAATSDFSSRLMSYHDLG